MLTFEIYSGRNHLFHWRLKSDARIICWSAGYKTFRGAKKALVDARKTNRLPTCAINMGPELKDATVRSIVDM